MTTLATADTIGPGTLFSLHNSTTLLEASGVTIASDTAAAIVGNGSGIRMLINGTIIGDRAWRPDGRPQ